MWGSGMTTTPETSWPALPYGAWKDTYATLHMWLQVIGKVALAQAPPLNHCWSVALRVTPRTLALVPRSVADFYRARSDYPLWLSPRASALALRAAAKRAAP